MLAGEKLVYSNNCKVLIKGERVILANRNSGLWIKISKQCYDILNKAIEYNLSQKDLIDNIQEKEDKEYFSTLLQKIDELDVLSHIDEKEGYMDIQLEQVYFSLTHRCNLNCIHCSVDAKNLLEDDFFNTKQIKDIIDKIVECNPKAIIFTGGEPLVRKDFLEILKYTSQKYTGTISLMTNGTLINDENVHDLIGYIQNIDISIDGIDEETCSLVRGKGVYSKVIESVKLLQRNGFSKISLSMVFGENNYYLKTEFLNQNKILGTRAVPRVFTAIGRGEKSKEFFLNKNGDSDKEKENNNLTEIKKTIHSCSCGAGYKEILINYDGSIYPCNLLTGDKYKICNVNDIGSIKDFFTNINLRKSNAFHNLNCIQPDIFDRCKNCNVNIFCWTCLHELDLIKENCDRFDNRCAYMKEVLDEIVWKA